MDEQTFTKYPISYYESYLIGYSLVPIKDNIYIIGGYDKHPRHPTKILNTIYLWNNGIWTKLPYYLSKSRSFHASAYYGGKIFHAGGIEYPYPESKTTASVESYDPKTGISEVRSPMVVPRSHDHILCIIDGKLYVFGGSGGNAKLAISVEVMDKDGVWSIESCIPLECGRGDFKNFVYSHIIYFFTKHFYIWYDTRKKIWSNFIEGSLVNTSSMFVTYTSKPNQYENWTGCF